MLVSRPDEEISTLRNSPRGSRAILTQAFWLQELSKELAPEAHIDGGLLSSRRLMSRDAAD